MFLVRIFKAIIAVILILSGLSIFGVVYLFRNPDKISRGFDYLVEKSLSGRAHQENEEFFLQGIENIRINAPHMDVRLRFEDTPNLKILLIGQVSVFDSGPFIQSHTHNSELLLDLQTHISSNFRVNINGQEVRPKTEQINVDIVVPKNYNNSLNVLTHSGQINVTIPKDVLIQVKADSRAGEIKNTYAPDIKNPTDVESVGSLDIRSNLGSITIQNP